MVDQIPITPKDMESAVVIDAGTMEFNAEDLTATGLLIPYGVPARSNLGTFTFSAGDIALPEDLTGMSLNVEHKREDVVGGFTKVWEQPEGTFAAFKYANTPAGRQAFEDGKSGKRKNLSAEVAKVRIQGGKALPGAVLFAAAQVEKPAFEGATLLAAEDTSVVDELAVSATEDSISYTEADVQRAVQAAIAALQTTPEAPASEVTEPPAAPAEDTEKKETLMATEVAGDVQTPAPVIPTTLLASEPAEQEVDLGTVFAAMHSVKSGFQSDDAQTLLAALSDIKVDASGGLTTAGSGVIQPAWVGKLWQGKRYVRRYMDLATHLYGGIQLGGRKGFTLDQGTALVAEWAGNKTELPTGTATTGTKSSSLKKYGYAADVAREWFDLEGGAEVIQAFFEGVVDSYAKVTDQEALKQIFTAASKNSTNLDRLVAPGTFPAQAGIGTYPAAMGMLIQAIEAVSDADDDAAFAVVNPIAWNQLLYTPKDLIPEYVEFSVGVGTGEATAGKVKVVKAPQSFFTGTVATAPQVIAGAKSAIEFREQGQTPIQIDALDIARGGIDKAVIGYLETFVVRPESLVLIGTKP